MKLFKTKTHAAEFCEGCSRVCDRACQASSLIERARGTVLAHGGRLV